MIRRLLTLLRSTREFVCHPLPPHAFGDPGCPCGSCVEARPRRIHEAAARIRATNWAFQAPANDSKEAGLGLAILLLRAKLFDGVAPPARDEDGEDVVTLDAEPEQTVATIRRAS